MHKNKILTKSKWYMSTKWIKNHAEVHLSQITFFQMSWFKITKSHYNAAFFNFEMFAVNVQCPGSISSVLNFKYIPWKVMHDALVHWFWWKLSFIPTKSIESFCTLIKYLQIMSWSISNYVYPNDTMTFQQLISCCKANIEQMRKR